MDEEENKKETTGDFGHVIDALHNKAKLPSLRTYQGDMAEFIKEKNESVISVAVKEKVREEKRETEPKKEKLFPKSNKNNFQLNFTITFLSLCLIVGGGLAFLYVWNFIKEPKIEQIIIDNDIIPHNNAVTLANITKENLGIELSKLTTNNGISIAKISDTNGHLINQAKDFFDFLKIPSTISIRKTLKDNFVVGTFNQNNRTSFLLIITVDDFGRAFASMLDWEESVLDDLNFLNAANTSDSDVFGWKDIIIKNKDARAFVGSKGNSKIAYTFLDKNTILITNNILVIADIGAIYASRAVAR